MLGALVGSLALLSGQVNAQNLLQNGGFELGLTSGPGGFYSGTTYGAWSAAGSPNNTFLFRMPSQSTPAYEGIEAMFIGDVGAAGLVSQSFTTTVGY